MGKARILLAGGGAETEAALRHAFADGLDELDIVHTEDPHEALLALVEERFHLCIARGHADDPSPALRLCSDAKEAGIRIPILVLTDIVSRAVERELLAAGALAALPWDGTEEATLRSLVHLTLGLRLSEENLRQSNDRLVMEMLTLQDQRERAEALGAEYVALVEDYALAKEELERLNQEKNKFFSIIAHDLRSPFTSLLGFSSLLHERVDTLAPEKIRDFAGHIHDSGNRVFRLLENLLEWARLQMNRVEVEPRVFALGDATAKTLEVLGPVAAEKAIRLDQSGEPPRVYADLHMTETVIRNLVNNALKFTPEGGAVTVAYETNAADGEARLSVRDTGVGMDAATAGKLFKLSENVTMPGTAGEKGTGLGLLLCKELVERNGGRIWVKSAPGRGSTFTFTLPLAAPGA